MNEAMEYELVKTMKEISNALEGIFYKLDDIKYELERINSNVEE